MRTRIELCERRFSRERIAFTLTEVQPQHFLKKQALLHCCLLSWSEIHFLLFALRAIVLKPVACVHSWEFLIPSTTSFPIPEEPSRVRFILSTDIAVCTKTRQTDFSSRLIRLPLHKWNARISRSVESFIASAPCLIPWHEASWRFWGELIKVSVSWTGALVDLPKKVPYCYFFTPPSVKLKQDLVLIREKTIWEQNLETRFSSKQGWQQEPCSVKQGSAANKVGKTGPLFG